MPLARIRSFDPEAIAFLAAQLAQSGYTLQFVRPDESGLEDADLELTVVRRDLDQALLTAQAEAERLGVDVTVVPGVLPIAEPEPIVAAPESVEPHRISGIVEPVAVFTDIPNPPPSPIDIEMPIAIEVTSATDEIEQDFAAEKARWAQVARESSEKTAHVLGRGIGKAVDGIEVISDSIGRGLAGGKENLAEIGGSTMSRLNEWKVRFRTARALRRQGRYPGTFSTNATVPRSPRRPRSLWMRERLYKGTALAAVLATAAIIGWTLAGYAGPPNPVGKGTGLSTVQEQVPFGPASAGAPVGVVSPAGASVKSIAKPKPALASATRPVRLHSDDDQEVIVRHFDQKPPAEQAKEKNRDLSRDGVKVISEE